MSQVITIRDGGATSQGPNDKLVYLFNWDEDNLAPATVQIASWSFTITQLSGPTTTPLAKDQESLLANNRQTQLRISGGDIGGKYLIANKIVTNETPSQTKERSFELLVERK